MLTIVKNDKYRNNGELLKALKRLIKYEDSYRFNICCYTSSDSHAAGYEDIITDLEIHTYINGEYVDAYWTHSVTTRIHSEDGAAWSYIMEEHRAALAEEKRKLYRYLNVRLGDVYPAGDISQ